MSDYKKTCDIIVNKCLNIKSGEKVIIITDKNKRKFAYNIFESAQKITDSIIIEIPPTRVNGEDPSRMVYEIVENADVIIAPTTMSLSHTRAFVNARNHGARVASLPGINEKMFLHSIDTNYDKITSLTTRLAEYCKGKDKIRVITKKGTEIEFSIKGRRMNILDGLCHEKGDFVNLPDGEMCMSPIENSVNGRMVIDLSMSPDHKTKFGKIGLLKNEVIDLTIKEGKITAFNGGKKAELLKKVILDSDENANCIAEFAFGTNPKARIIGYILEDEKALGTVHFAFGSNVSLGGKNQSNLHVDGIISKADVYIDDMQILKTGKYLI
jgi:leucyl aminopeptidase (aminopeptidase T)